MIGGQAYQKNGIGKDEMPQAREGKRRIGNLKQCDRGCTKKNVDTIQNLSLG